MADTYKVLNQAYPNAYTLTPIYIVPTGKRAIVSTISICNQNTDEGSFRISIAIENAADASKQYVYYDEPVRGCRTFSATQGWTLQAGDVVRGFGNGSMSFTLFGVESDV